MSVVSYEVRDGKATYEGRSLAAWVPDVVRLLVERFRPARVILFGSVARGDDGRDSDIDLLVVLPELRVRHHDAAVAMLRALRDLPVPVDVVVTDQTELQERMATPGVVRVACREGGPGPWVNLVRPEPKSGDFRDVVLSPASRCLPHEDG